jgi:hypothetical protein
MRIIKKCPHGRQKHICKECGGTSICPHSRIRSHCKDCGGTGICEHNRLRTTCIPCKGGGVCSHDKKRDNCRICSPQSFCEHNRRKGTCKDCGGGSMCEHGRQRSNCKNCGGSAVCILHGRTNRSCRLCFPKSWAVRILSANRANAKRAGYCPPVVTAEDILILIDKSPLCCGCEEVLDYSQTGFKAPCLHHNHETGEVVGFAHRECNSLEGQLQKLGHKIPIFLKNFFPQVSA